ncbi:hypothetical protein F5Y19DRAFT_473613 [Xylariaceae sp. FL1651]|nr:hypothetical protein F5Y19DRAFT_473613 [Xylariaceae sp. FL1651]
MPETLQSILCSETWVWDPNGSCQITFDKSGTGKLICRSEASVFIAAEFDWELASPTSPAAAALSAIAVDPASPTHLVTLPLTITLTKRRIPYLGDFATSRVLRLNEDLLHDSAFAPRTYAVRVERGDFLSTPDTGSSQTQQRELPKFTPRFALRLVFDASPYPPAEAWRDPDGAPASFKVWEFTEFCGRPCGTVADSGGASSGGWGLGKILGGLTGRS